MNYAILQFTMELTLVTSYSIEGSTTVFYLFVREKFQWTVKDFTTYETISILIPIVGNVLGVWLLRKVRSSNEY